MNPVLSASSRPLQLREELISSLDAQATPQALWQTIYQRYEARGFDRIIYLHGTRQRVEVRSNFDASWNEHYIEKGFMQRDPFLRYCTTRYEPVRTGIDHVREHPYLSAAECQVIEEASECGFRSGFSCTLQRFNGYQVNAWNIGSRLDAGEVSRIMREQHDELVLLSFYAAFFHQNLDKQHPASTGQPLTDRECCCLELSARGLRTRDIADTLKRSEATVEFHLRNAREKLGARTREHAVYLALKQQLIQL